MEHAFDFDRIAAFVEKRRKTSGGYGATPRLPATIQDTFQAVAILDDLAGLGGTPPHRTDLDRNLADFVVHKLALPWLGILTTFQLLSLGHRLGLAADGERIHRRFASAPTAEEPLTTAWCAVRIAREILDLPPHRLLPEPSVELPEYPTLTDAARYVFVRAALDLPLAVPVLTDWIRRSQNGDGGFGFYPGTTSFIENCHGALAALALLGAEPTDPGGLFRFLLSCQTGAGGFSRNPAAAPFLDATWHAVRCLALLHSPPRRA
ncbi:MAG: prenyltransferase/squalene oxidase repeat-containing protein [Thermodesulfobacteriota bacterium]